MKSLLLLLVAFTTVHTTFAQQDKSKRPSPPAMVKETLASGAVISIDYSQPSIKGRTIGKDVEPMDGKVWRAGANEATVFEASKNVKVEGKDLAAGKYGLYMIANGDTWTIIFNKTWKIWGTEYKEADDALRVDVKAKSSTKPMEKLTYTIARNGTVTLWWGDKEVAFNVK